MRAHGEARIQIEWLQSS